MDRGRGSPRVAPARVGTGLAAAPVPRQKVRSPGLRVNTYGRALPGRGRGQGSFLGRGNGIQPSPPPPPPSGGAEF